MRSNIGVKKAYIDEKILIFANDAWLTLQAGIFGPSKILSNLEKSSKLSSTYDPIGGPSALVAQHFWEQSEAAELARAPQDS